QQAAIMKMYGYPYQIEVVGWPYSIIKPFSKLDDHSMPASKPLNVLLALNHPNTHGPIPMFQKDIEDNEKVLEILLNLQQEGFINLTVRYGGKLERNLFNTTFKIQPRAIEQADYTHFGALNSIRRHNV